MVDLTSSTLVIMFSLWVSREGNLPALFSPGPRIRGICLIRDSEARKASYFLAKQGENTVNKKQPAITKGAVRHETCPLRTEFLNKLFVLVQLLQSLDVHVRQISSFGLIAVLLVSQNTYREFGPGKSLQPGCLEYIQSIPVDTSVHDSTHVNPVI